MIMHRHVHHRNERRRTRSTSDHQDFNRDECKIINGVSVYKNKEHWSRMSSSLNRYRSGNKFCDFQLKINECLFNAHRVVLAAASNYFEAMITNDLAERENNYVEIKGIETKIFEMLLNYIYGAEIVVNVENVQELLAAANMLELMEVVCFCCKFLQKQLDPSNCIGIYSFAEFHSCQMLRLEAKRYIERHFAEVILEEEFFDLPKDTLKNFLKSEGLSIDSEFQVLEATMKWIMKDVDNRIVHFGELMESIRVPVIPIKQIENCIQDCNHPELKNKLDSLLIEHKETIAIVDSDKKQNLIANKSLVSPVYLGIRWQPRMCARKSVYVIGGMNQFGHRWNDGKSVSTVERLDVLRGQWKSLPPMLQPRSCHGIAVLNGLIFVAGGECDSRILETCEIYDPLENEWTRGKSLRQPRSCFGMCALDSFIYALGGWIGNLVGNSIERYDPNTNEWKIYDKLPDIRFAMGVISYDGLIYIIGGFDEHNYALQSVLSYNPVTRQFQNLCRMHQSRAYFGCNVLHGHIYVAGGTDGTQPLYSVERYNILENKWSNVCHMPIARISPCAISVNDCLLVIGGKTAGDEFSIASTLDSVDIYDPESNQWNESIPIPTSRCEATVAVI